VLYFFTYPCKRSNNTNKKQTTRQPKAAKTATNSKYAQEHSGLIFPSTNLRCGQWPTSLPRLSINLRCGHFFLWLVSPPPLSLFLKIVLHRNALPTFRQPFLCRLHSFSQFSIDYMAIFIVPQPWLHGKRLS
ncbi:unnamed protein product, partial [Candidula unifasciata]